MGRLGLCKAKSDNRINNKINNKIAKYYEPREQFGMLGANCWDFFICCNRGIWG